MAYHECFGGGMPRSERNKAFSIVRLKTVRLKKKLVLAFSFAH